MHHVAEVDNKRDRGIHGRDLMRDEPGTPVRQKIGAERGGRAILALIDVCVRDHREREQESAFDARRGSSHGLFI
jgi:hypothetical protein